MSGPSILPGGPPILPGGPRAIDVHAHYAPPGYRAVAAACAARDPRFAELNDNVAPGDDAAPLSRLDVRLAEMDAAGIRVQVISVNPPSAVPDDPALAGELMAAANDGLLEACARHPERFVMMAALPLPHAGASLAELDRLAGRSALRGVCVGTGSVAYAPDRAEWSAVLERTSELGLPLLLHPMRMDPSSSDDPFVSAFADHGLMSALQSMTGTSLAALRLALSGTLDRLPRLDVIVPHLGGVIPYLAQRLVDQARGASERGILDHLRSRFYYDNCSFHEPALRCAIDTVGAGRIMLGSDYPYRGGAGRPLETLAASDLAEDVKRTIATATAERWFVPGSPREDRRTAAVGAGR